MKKLYLFWLLSLVGAVQLRAQAVDSLKYKLDYLLAPLDKSQVPTGLLAGYGASLAPMTSFNGVLADSTVLTASLFRGLYATAYTANVYGPNPLVALGDVNSRATAAEAAAGPAAIPVMVQRIDYAAVRPDAISQNLLRYQDNQFYDVAGRSASPYSPQTLFAAAPTRTYSPTGYVSLVFPQNLYLESIEAPGNAGQQLQSLAVDFTDGRGYVPATFGQPVAATLGPG